MIVESCLTGRQEVINSKLIDKVECGAVITFNDGEKLFVDEHYNKFMKRWKGVHVKDMEPGSFGTIVNGELEGRKIFRLARGFAFLNNGVRVNPGGTWFNETRVKIHET